MHYLEGSQRIGLSRCKHNALSTLHNVAVLQVMVKWLSEQPVDNREENKDGTSPLDIAAQFGHLEVAEWLKEQEVEVSEKDSPYSTGFRYYSHSGILPGNNFNDFIIYVKAQNNPHAIIGVHEMIFC